MASLIENVNRVSEISADINNAIINKGVTPTGGLSSYAEAISHISQGSGGGTDVSDTTATESDVLLGKVFHKANGNRAEGTIPTLSAASYTPGTSEQVIGAGQYIGGTQTILGDANLVPENIKKDVSIFGVLGTLESGGGGGVQMASDVVPVTYKTTFNIDLPFEADLFIGQYRNVSGALLGTVSLQRLNESELINQWSFWTSARNSGATEVNHKYTAGTYNDAISDYLVTDDNHITRVTITTASTSASYGSGTMEWFAFKF